MYTLKLNVRGDMDMKDVVLNELKKELNEKEMRNVLENICKYFNKDVSLMEKYNSKH